MTKEVEVKTKVGRVQWITTTGFSELTPFKEAKAWSTALSSHRERAE